jgi:hypothetical protein
MLALQILYEHKEALVRFQEGSAAWLYHSAWKGALMEQQQLLPLGAMSDLDPLVAWADILPYIRHYVASYEGEVCSLGSTDQDCTGAQVCMPLTCRSHAAHMPLTRLSHAAHMLLTCRSHAAHMLLTCLSHAAHMPLTCRPHAAHAPPTYRCCCCGGPNSELFRDRGQRHP